MHPFEVTAYLRNSIVIDPRTGIALDGLLAGQVRSRHAHEHHLEAPSLTDNGLTAPTPTEWDLPLNWCTIPGAASRHWLTTTGQILGPDGTIARTTDTQHIVSQFDERRARHTTIALTQHVSSKEGRFRNKITPVVAVPADRIVWRGIGNPDAVIDLLEPLTAIGGRRGAGYGTIRRWTIETCTPDDPVVFAHTHPDGTLGRPLPIPCANHCGLPVEPTGIAGIRPPLFHPATQRILVVPELG